MGKQSSLLIVRYLRHLVHSVSLLVIRALDAGEVLLNWSRVQPQITHPDLDSLHYRDYRVPALDPSTSDAIYFPSRSYRTSFAVSLPLLSRVQSPEHASDSSFYTQSGRNVALLKRLQRVWPL